MQLPCWTDYPMPRLPRTQYPIAIYLTCAGVAAVLVSLTSAILFYGWAAGLPKTSNSIKPGGIPIWAGVVAVAAFTTIVLLATAFAPTRILRSLAMVWLVAMSGTRSIVGLRAILFVLAAIAGAVSALCFLVAKGS